MRIETTGQPDGARIDTVISRGDETRVLIGTQASGATLTNLRGCASVPDGWEVERYVLVDAGTVTISP